MFFKQYNSPLDSFLDSLTYWQKLNLYTVLKSGQSELSFKDAKSEGISREDGKLKFLLEQALNSPTPKP